MSAGRLSRFVADVAKCGPWDLSDGGHLRTLTQRRCPVEAVACLHGDPDPHPLEGRTLRAAALTRNEARRVMTCADRRVEDPLRARLLEAAGVAE